MGVILLLEDNDFMRKHIEGLITTDGYLKEAGYYVEAYQRIDQAKEFFSEHKDEIDCIVTDLNMSDEWLEDYISESYGCILSGWVWLYRFVFPQKPDIPTVIYSSFLKELNTNIPDDQRPFLKKPNIEQVAKGADDKEGLKGLEKAIRKVAQI